MARQGANRDALGDAAELPPPVEVVRDQVRHLARKTRADDQGVGRREAVGGPQEGCILRHLEVERDHLEVRMVVEERKHRVVARRAGQSGPSRTGSGAPVGGQAPTDRGYDRDVTDGAVNRRALDPAFELVARQVREEPEISAAALAVADGTGLIRREAFGREEGVGVDGVFLLASITKSIVATGVMQLVEAGRLVLGAPVARYLPEFAPPPAVPGTPGGEAVTTWHLLTHTSGMIDADWDDPGWERITPGGLYAEACRRPLEFAPGLRYRYCSDSFSILGELIRRLSGLPYPDYLRERLFEPLGMVDTAFDSTRFGTRRAPILGLDRPGVPYDEAVRRFDALALPGVGLWSTAGDIVAFGQAMLNGGERGGVRVLTRPFVELMTREQTAGVFEPGVPPRAPHYALGWDKPTLDGSMPGSPAAFGHAGATGTRLWVDPVAGLVIVYLANRWGASDRHWRAAVAAVYAAMA